MAALRHQIQIIADRHRAVVTAAHERLDKLSDAQLHWSPDDKKWSIALIVDHLIKVHVATSPLFMKALLSASPAGDEVDKDLPYSFMDRTMVQLMSPGARFKLPVPKVFEPAAHKGRGPALVQHLQDEFEAFNVILGYANEKKLKGIRIKAAAGGMKPSVIAYLDATVQHNRYHWLQIEALLRDRSFPQS